MGCGAAVLQLTRAGAVSPLQELHVRINPLKSRRRGAPIVGACDQRWGSQVRVLPRGVRLMWKQMVGRARYPDIGRRSRGPANLPRPCAGWI